MRRLTIFGLMWLGCAISCAASSSVLADDPDQLAARAIHAGKAQDIHSIPSLAEGLNHESPLVRKSSAWALSQMGAAVSEVVPALTQALADQDAKVRCAAATSLGNLGHKAWRAESALWQATLDQDVDVRCAALIALRTVSVAKHSAALGALSECLQSPQADVQSEALATTSVIQSNWNDDEKRTLVPHLSRVFATAQDSLRLASAVLLGDLGLPAAPVIPALASAVDDLDEHVRAAALRTLGRLSDDVDQRWNQLQAEQRAALRRPCDLAAKTLASHGNDSAEISRLAEQYQRLADGILLISGEELIPSQTTANPLGPEKPLAVTKTNLETISSSSAAWKWGLAGIASCLGLLLLWRVSLRRTVAQTLPIISPTSDAEPPSERQSIAGRVEITIPVSDASSTAPEPLGQSRADDDSLAHCQSASASSVPPYLLALQDEDSRVRQAAAIALGQIGLGAIDAVPQLTLALSDPDSHVRAAAAFALSAFGPYAMEAVPELRGKLADESAAVRARAAFALGQIGPAARRAGDELARLVSDPDVLVRRNSVSALGGIGADTAVALSALRLAIADADVCVQRYAVTSLELIGPVSSAAELGVEGLRQHASECPLPSDSSRDDKLSMSQPKSEESVTTVPQLVSVATMLVLYNPEQIVSAESVGNNGRTLEASDFLAQLEDADSEVRCRALNELSRLGAAALPEMIASLNHRNPEVRRLLIQALGRAGIEARSAVAPLRIALHDVNAEVRSAAAECLGQLGVVSRPMVQDLMQSLSDSNSDVRCCAAKSLGHFGQHAREATAALQVAAISDVSESVRSAAHAARQQITESLAGAA